MAFDYFRFAAFSCRFHLFLRRRWYNEPSSQAHVPNHFVATFRKRKREDGTFACLAQIRIMRDGRQVYQESQTSDRQQMAEAWATRRESGLSEPGAIEKASR